MTILDEILERKRAEVRAAKQRLAPDALEERARRCDDAPRGFRRALVEAVAPAVIAEIKRRSPSKGEIRADFDPVGCGEAYARGGAAAISVLTDEHYFGGHLDYLHKVRARVDLPLLRKDFILDPYQVDEARVAGADAILLIVAALDPEKLVQLRDRATALGLDVLVEVHDAEELDTALAAGVDLLGVNNRNLKTFETRLEVTEELAARLPPDAALVLVAESGISSPADIARLQEAGARAFLVGESLMRQPDVSRALIELRRKP